MINDQDIVSVIMPVFNAENFLAEAIGSILDQTHKNFELIIVDDGSNDGSAEIIESFATRDSRIKVVNQQNLGPAEAMNTGLELAKSDWIFRMDADDVMLPHRIEKQISFIRSNPRVQITSCLAHYINDEGRIFGTTTNSLRTENDFNKLVSRGETIGLLQPGAAMNRNTVMKIGGYRKQFRAAEDIDLWNRVAEQGILILVQDDILMKYRIHKNSIMSSDFMSVRQQYDWVRACISARRRGDEEPNWEKFLAKWNSIPWFKKLNRWRKMYSKHMYRSAGYEFLYKKPTKGAFKLLLASACQPSYVFFRAWEQMRKQTRKRLT